MHLSEAAHKAKLQKDAAKIARYRKLSDLVLQGKENHVYTKEALEQTTTLLELNPEYNAVWNYRRDVMVHLFDAGELSAQDVLTQELHMVLAMMKQYPKCYWIWNHRRWCLEELDKRAAANWQMELAIVHKLLEMDSRNYHGWHYRRYVVSNIRQRAVEKLQDPSAEQIAAVELPIYLAEFTYTTGKINKNISNFSAWHGRTKLIPAIFKAIHSVPVETLQKDTDAAAMFLDPAKFFSHELNLVKTGMFMDSDDTSVWLYTQWLLTNELFYEHSTQEAYEGVLQAHLRDVEELNELEKQDSATNADHVWCVKTIVFIKALLNKSRGKAAMDDTIQELLQKLVALDPLRRGRVLDQIAGREPVL